MKAFEDREKEKEQEISKEPGKVALHMENNQNIDNISESIWTEDEIKLLSKAVARYPGGTQERWEKVAAFVKTKSVEEVLQRVKDLKKSSRKPLSEVSAPPQPEEKSENTAEIKEEWTSEQQSHFESALRSVPKDHPDRWSEIANLVKGKSKKDCIKRFKEIRAMLAKQ
jgi:hypothetical protein